jgi:cytochrome P450
MMEANLFCAAKRTSTGSTRRLPPGPRELPFLGSGLASYRDPLGFLLQLQRRYGDVARFHLPPRLHVYLLSHPDAIEEALLSEHEHLFKDALTRELSLLLGRGLLTSEGAFWRRQRRLAQPAFHHKRVQAYGDVMVRASEALLTRLPDGQRRDLHADFMRLTLEIVAETLFGTDIGDAAGEIADGIAVFTARFTGLGPMIPDSLPIPRNARIKRAHRRMDEIVYGFIKKRRSEPDRGDLLSMLLHATTEEGGSMSDEQLRDEAMTLLLAGHETTALVLSYTCDLLGRHPEVEARLFAELCDVLGDRPATAADLPRLSYTDAVVRESMRLYPPAWVIGREAISPCRIAGYDIEPGTQLWMSQWVVHRDPRYFPEPERFTPERWLAPNMKELPRYAYFPFGGGPRVCIGNAFAMMEAVLVLATLMRRIRFVPDPRPLRPMPAVTLRPRHGVHGVVHRRAP